MLLIVPAMALLFVVVVVGSLLAYFALTGGAKTSEHGERGDFETSHLVNGVRCGIERWDIKTLQDPGAASVRTSRSVPAKVALMRVWLPPSKIGPTRFAPIETTRYVVRARLVEAKFEADSDIHLVIADPLTGGTMIVEFPNPGCTLRASAANRKRMTAARTAFIKAEGSPSPSRWKRLSGLATISGVGFFDFPHGQTGVAPNAIELHPALSFNAR